MKCPKCHGSDLFENNNPYSFSAFFKMPDKCPKCGQKFLLEPGFYYGAMYVAYALSIAYLVSVYVAMLVLYPSFTITEYLAVGVGSLFLLTPVVFRLSRAFYINFFVSHDPDAIEKNKKEKARGTEY